MLRLRLPRAIALSLCLIAVACSNGTHKKKPLGNDASTYEGGADGNGAGGSDAGVDAPMEATPEAAPEAQADAPMDSPSEPEAGLTCSAGTIKDYAQQVCRMCPSDAGLEGGADAGAMDGSADAASDGGALDGSMDATSEASTDPYAQMLDCNGVIGNTSGSYDPTTGVLDFQITYPLDIRSVSITGAMMSGQQPLSTFSIPNIPVSDNHVTLTIGTPPNGVDQIVIGTFDMTDACGRSTSYDPGVTCINLAAAPDDAGTGWTVACIPYPC